jgi:hypothetical protein
MMKMSLFAGALGLTLFVLIGVVKAHGDTWAVVSTLAQDNAWTVIEYPDGQEVEVALLPATSTDAKGTARVKRTGNDVSIHLEVSGLPEDSSAHQVYLVDSMGNATMLGTLTVSDGSGTLDATSALQKFMLVISPDADLTTIGSEIKVVLRSAVPSGFNVVAKETPAEAVSAEPTTTNSETETPVAESPEYDIPLLGVGSLRPGATMNGRAMFAGGFEGTRASIAVKPQKNRPTQIKVRLTNLKQPPEGMQYLLWEINADNSYSLLGRLTPGKKNETKIDATTASSDFGLFITTESAEGNPTSPTGSLVATIVK